MFALATEISSTRSSVSNDWTRLGTHQVFELKRGLLVEQPTTAFGTGLRTDFLSVRSYRRKHTFASTPLGGGAGSDY